MKALYLTRKASLTCLSLLLAAALCLSSALVGCGSGDDTVAPALDGAADQTTDVIRSDAPGNPTDATQDVSRDTQPEASPSPEAGFDALSDASSDSPSDAASDTAPDAVGDGGQGDGEAGCSIAIPAQSDFVNTVATLACQRTQSCCLLSASQFNMAQCLAIYTRTGSGGWVDVALVEPYIDGGRIGYDPSAACQCMQNTANVNCGLITSQNLAALRGSCTQALPGLSPIDGGCTSSLECTPTSGYCTSSDAGTCKPLVPDGGPCTKDDMCSYAALGNPSLYCDTAASNACVPRFGDDAGCQRGPMCTSNVCLFANGVVSCQSSGVFSDPGVAGGLCDFFTIKDAGGGG